MSDTLTVLGLGRMSYAEALSVQRTLANARIDGTIDHDILILVEHPHVITLGRSSRPENLPTSHEALTARGISVHEIERGGDVTYHGPGQLVGYPIYNLTEHQPDLHVFLRQIEEALIRALSHFGIAAGREPGLTGVWTSRRKIASIGIHVKKWVTWHGFALNVSTDLSFFDLIVPCGIENVVMTSVHRELGARTPRDCWSLALDYVVLEFSEVFGQQPQAGLIEDLMHQRR